MMFNGLDQVDWKGLGHHVYGRHEQIPQEIRNLLSEDEDEREHARGFLLGEGQDFGDIYDTTPHIIHFLLEVLENPEAPDRIQLLSHLSGVAERSSNPYSSSVATMRLRLQTYDALKARLEMLIALLNDPSSEARIADAELLGWMIDDVESVSPALMQRFHEEPDEPTQIAMLKASKNLLHALDWRRFSLRDQFAPFFKEVVESHPSLAVRLAAAHASVELVGWPASKEPRISPAVPGLLAQEFLAAHIEPDWHKPGVRIYEAQEMAKDISKLMDRDVLLALLREPGLSAEQAHLVVRALLAVILLNGKLIDSHWRRFPHRDRRPGPIYIEQLDALGHLRPGTPYKVKRPILQAILDAEKAWEIPSNLFSFFYGLPDSREALRSLLEQLDARTK